MSLREVRWCCTAAVPRSCFAISGGVWVGSSLCSGWHADIRTHAYTYYVEAPFAAVAKQGR